jgi:hypothetical protein
MESGPRTQGRRPFQGKSGDRYRQMNQQYPETVSQAVQCLILELPMSD